MKKFLVAGVVGSGLLVLTAQEPVAPAVFTAGQAEAGRKAFQDKGGTPANPEAACAYCHTIALTGRNGDPGEMPPLSSLSPALQKNIQLMGARVPPLAGEKFMRVWGAKSTQDLVERIKIAAGPDEATAVNLAAYILQVNGAKSGDQALSGNTAVEIRAVVAADRH
jgi:hypothetical protein